MSSPKEFHMDAVYPEPLSRLRRGHGLSNSCSESSTSPSYRRAVRKQTRRGNTSTGGRFRTQPITFHEIKEVDEDNLAEYEPEKSNTAGAASKSESDLKAKFELFYRSIDANTNNNNDKNANATKSLTSKKLETTTNISNETESSSINNTTIISSPPNSTTQPTPTSCSSATKRNQFISQDDSTSPTTNPINTNINFNPKSRPSL